MSVVNQMLRDLDARSMTAQGAVVTGWKDIHATTARSVAKGHHHRYWLVGIVLAAAVTATLVHLLSVAPVTEDSVAAIPANNETAAAAPGTAPTAEVSFPLVQAVAAGDDRLPVKPVSEPRERSVAIAAAGDRTPPKTMPQTIKALANAAGKVTAPATADAVRKVVHTPGPVLQAEQHYMEARQALRLGRSRQAERLLQQALGLHAQHHEARLVQAQLLAARKSTAAAIELLQRGLELAPRYTPYIKALARIHLESGAPARALLLLTSHATLLGRDIEGLALLANACQQGGQWQRAVTAYRKVLALDATRHRAWLGLAMSLENLEQTSEAAHAYRQVIALGAGGVLAQHARQRLNGMKQ